MPQKRKNWRIIEIITGLILILAVLTMLVAVLLSFDYTIPNATFTEDIDFMKDSILRQRVSSISWLVAGGASLLFLPAYLLMFHRFQIGMHILNSVFILMMSIAFFWLGTAGLHIATVTARILDTDLLPGDAVTMEILENIRLVHLLHKAGLTAFGIFATIFTVARFSEVKFPVFGSTLTFLAAPILITFTLLNPDHLLRTSALAMAWTGLLIIGARFVTLGLREKAEDPKFSEHYNQETGQPNEIDQ